MTLSYEEFKKIVNRYSRNTVDKEAKIAALARALCVGGVGITDVPPAPPAFKDFGCVRAAPRRSSDSLLISTRNNCVLSPTDCWIGETMGRENLLSFHDVIWLDRDEARSIRAAIDSWLADQ